MTTPQIVTRFNVFTRAADDAEGTDERDVIRLFEKRKLIVSLDLDDVTRFGEDDFDAAALQDFIDAKPRAATEVMDWLGEEPAEEGDDEDEEKDGGSVVPDKYRVRYGAPQNCGDAIALALTGFVTLPRKDKKNPDGGLDRAKLRAVAEANGIGDKLADWEERGLNGGLLRMNTANVLRGMNRRGEEVVIGGETWPAHEVPKKVRKTRAKANKPAA